jgi:hypothetical protein
VILIACRGQGPRGLRPPQTQQGLQRTPPRPCQRGATQPAPRARPPPRPCARSRWTSSRRACRRGRMPPVLPRLRPRNPRGGREGKCHLDAAGVLACMAAGAGRAAGACTPVKAGCLHSSFADGTAPYEWGDAGEPPSVRHGDTSLPRAVHHSQTSTCCASSWRLQYALQRRPEAARRCARRCCLPQRAAACCPRWTWRVRCTSAKVRHAAAACCRRALYRVRCRRACSPVHRCHGKARTEAGMCRTRRLCRTALLTRRQGDTSEHTDMPGSALTTAPVSCSITLPRV